MIRVGFEPSFDEGWMGGINYFRNLLTALYSLPERDIEAVIFTGTRSPEKFLAGFPAVKIVRNRLFDRWSLPWLGRKLWLRCFTSDLLFERLLKKHNVALLSHSGWLGKNKAIPVIGWIPDFQHVQMPEFFGKEEIALRNKLFSNLCRYCSTIIVSSFDAQSNLIRFVPGCAPKSKVLQFVVAPAKPDSNLPGRSELEKRYDFSGKFFLLPNQFWKHKNHQAVVEALGLLVRDGKRVLVLATGSKTDQRHPEYFQSLMSYAKDLDVLENFIHLGLVPASDLAALMREATAIINPSFFEGWSTSVEEAKALGKRVLLSDIPVHREQNPARASFFPPQDARALSAILWDVWKKTESDENVENAQRETEERRLEFARQYQDIVFKTLENR